MHTPRNIMAALLVLLIVAGAALRQPAAPGNETAAAIALNRAGPRAEQQRPPICSPRCRRAAS
ncbi:MAG: hypothetical protein IPM07_27465 [Anaerolineales bacterium]|nr:hypothetical protein [Anaerolineales bacterium]